MKHLLYHIFISLVALLCPAVQAMADVEEEYVLVTDAESLRKGDQVVIVSREYGKAMSKYNNKTNPNEATYVKPCGIEVTDDGNKVNLTNDSVCVMTLVGDSKGWKFKVNDNTWLWAYNGSFHKLLYGSDSGPNGNLINTLTISIKELSNCLLNYKYSNLNHYLKYNGSDRFNTYNSISSACPIQLYRKQRILPYLSFGESEGNVSTANSSLGSLVHSVQIDRSFVSDGGFYTLCLPFDLTATDISTSFRGAKFYRFASVLRVDEGMYTLHFEPVDHTSAGVPYLIKPLAQDDADIIAPMLSEKIITTDTPQTITNKHTDVSVSFIGTFDPVLLPAKGIIRFVGSSGLRLVTPNAEGSLKGLRAYFELEDAMLSANFEAEAAKLSAILVLDDINGGGTTGASSVESAPASNTNSADAIYNMVGQRLAVDSRSLPKGLYVVGGKKMVVR